MHTDVDLRSGKFSLLERACSTACVEDDAPRPISTNLTSHSHGLPPAREERLDGRRGYLAMDLALLNYDGMACSMRSGSTISLTISRTRPDGSPVSFPTARAGGTMTGSARCGTLRHFIIPYTRYTTITATCVPSRRCGPSVERYLEYLADARGGRRRLVTYGIGDWVFYRDADSDRPTPRPASITYDNVLMSPFRRTDWAATASVHARKAEHSCVN